MRKILRVSLESEGSLQDLKPEKIGPWAKFNSVYAYDSAQDRDY